MTNIWISTFHYHLGNRQFILTANCRTRWLVARSWDPRPWQQQTHPYPLPNDTMLTTPKEIIGEPWDPLTIVEHDLLSEVSDGDNRNSVYRPVILDLFEIRKHLAKKKFSVQSMSLNIHMKMVRSSNSSGLVWQASILSWISLRICNVVNPVKYFTRTQLVLHRFQINLCIRWTAGNIEADLFTVDRLPNATSSPDKEPSLRRRIPLLSPIWLLCHATR